MKNILLERFSSEATDIFEQQLRNKVDIKIVVYIDGSWNEDTKKKYLNKSAELLNCFSISKGIDIDNCPWSIGDVEQKYFGAHEGIFLSVLSRYNVYKKAFTTEEMLDHYYRLVNFWINKVKNIDAVFSLDIPHVPSSFALYLVTKFLKIPFIFIDGALVYNKFNSFACSFKHRMLLVQKEQLTAKVFINAHSDFYNKYHSSSQGVVNKYIEFIDNRVERLWWRKILEDVNSSLPISIKSIFHGRIKFRNLYTTELGWKITRRRWDNPKSGFLRPFLILAKIKERIKILSLKNRYRRMCSNHKKLNNYIFFATSMEPESSTIPTALNGRHITIALRRIFDVLPNDYTVVYKEHPTQFTQQILFTTEWKSKYFYEELKKIGKIIFVKDYLSAKDLIEGSIGVATINGTIGIEALMQGKRCITFAPQWYDDYDGLHYVKSRNDIADAVKLMLEQAPPKPLPNQIKFSKHFLEMEGCNLDDYTKADLKKICVGIWSAYNDFLDIDDRKWEV